MGTSVKIVRLEPGYYKYVGRVDKNKIQQII